MTESEPSSHRCSVERGPAGSVMKSLFPSWVILGLTICIMLPAGSSEQGNDHGQNEWEAGQDNDRGNAFDGERGRHGRTPDRGARHGRRPRPGGDLTYYLDREAYCAALNQGVLSLEEMARSTTPQRGGQHLGGAHSRLRDAQAAFNSGKMPTSLEYLAQVIQQVELAADKGAVGASSVADTLAQASHRAGHELVQCIYGFSYEGSPHIRNANESLAKADEELVAGRRAAAARFYHQAVQKAKVVFEGNHIVRPGGDPDERQIQETWNVYREGLIRGDTAAALATVTEEFQERFSRIYAGISRDTLARITREMAAIRPARALGPTLRWYNVPRYIPVIDRTIDFMIYFQQVDGVWKVVGF